MQENPQGEIAAHAGALFAWKRLSDGKIMTPHLAHSKEELFEQAGFGAVRVDEPIKGFLAVEVRRAGTRLVEVKRPG